MWYAHDWQWYVEEQQADSFLMHESSWQNADHKSQFTLWDEIALPLSRICLGSGRLLASS